MKVYIWEGVLGDHTDGMAVAYAETLEQALKQFEDHTAKKLGEPTTIIDTTKESEPFGAYVWGD